MIFCLHFRFHAKSPSFLTKLPKIQVFYARLGRSSRLLQEITSQVLNLVSIGRFGSPSPCRCPATILASLPAG